MIQYNPSDLHICRATRSQSLICVLLGGPSKLVDLSFGNSRFLKAVAAIMIAMNAPRPPLVAAFFPGIVCTVHSDGILYAPVPHCHLLFRLAPAFSLICLSFAQLRTALVLFYVTVRSWTCSCAVIQSFGSLFCFPAFVAAGTVTSQHLLLVLSLLCRTVCDSRLYAKLR